MKLIARSGWTLHCPPVRRIEALFAQWLKRRPLCVLEDGERALAGGAVDAGPGELEAPADRLALQVPSVPPVFAAEEVVAHVGDVPFDVRLVPGRSGSRGVDDEAPVARILLEAALKDRVVAGRPGLPLTCSPHDRSAAGR